MPTTLTNGCIVAYPMNEASGTNRLDATGRGNTLTPSFTPSSYTDPIYLGQGTVGHSFAGALARFGKWNRLLTAGEKTTLRNSGSAVKWSDISASSLNDAVFYYNLDEASGNRVDATGRNSALAPTNAPGRTTGPDGTASAAQFAGGGDYLSTTDAADFRIGNFDFTILIWVNINSVSSGSAVDYFIGKATGDNVEWLFYYPHAAGRSRWQFDLGYEITDPNLANVKCSTAGQPSASTWYMLLAEYNSATNSLSVTVNNTDTDTFTPTAVPNLTAYTGAVLGSQFVESAAFDSSTVPTGRVGPKHLYRTSGGSDDLSGGNVDYTIAFWFKLDVLTSTMMLCGKWDANNASPDYAIWWDFANTRLTFQIGNGTGSNAIVVTRPLNDTNLHFALAEVDAGNQISLTLDNGTTSSLAISGFTPAATAVQFRIGSIVNGDASYLYYQFVGKMGPWFKWNRLLTTDEKVEAYNNGSPLYYPFEFFSIYRPISTGRGCRRGRQGIIQAGR